MAYFLRTLLFQRVYDFKPIYVTITKRIHEMPSHSSPDARSAWYIYLHLPQTIAIWLYATRWVFGFGSCFFFRICFSHLEILWKSCQKSKAAIADYGKHVAGFLCWSFLWMYGGWVKSHLYHSSPYIIYMWCAIVIVLRGQNIGIYWGYIQFFPVQKT